jgi:hypothetical protein
MVVKAINTLVTAPAMLAKFPNLSITQGAKQDILLWNRLLQPAFIKTFVFDDHPTTAEPTEPCKRAQTWCHIPTYPPLFSI